jgi:polyisoprenoid-binding protein YceI
MKKATIIFYTLGILVSFNTMAQGKFYTKTGKISFFSSTSMEDIDASNKSVTVLLDTKTGNLQFAVLMKGFEFKKALMQEDFNKDYVESDKFPRGEFKGQVTNNSEINYTTNGNYTAKVKGKLTIHGETKDIETTGTINVADGKIILHSSFSVLVADYKISIPKLYRNNISNTIKVTADCTLGPL